MKTATFSRRHLFASLPAVAASVVARPSPAASTGERPSKMQAHREVLRTLDGATSVPVASAQAPAAAHLAVSPSVAPFAMQLAEARRLALHWRARLGVTGDTTLGQTQRLADLVGLPSGSLCTPAFSKQRAIRTDSGWWVSSEKHLLPDPAGRSEHVECLLANAVAHYLLRPTTFTGIDTSGEIPVVIVPQEALTVVEGAAVGLIDAITATFVITWTRA